MRSVSQPSLLPKFFIDRSLGRKAVPEALRADGWDVITLAEHYGMPLDQQVADTEWIEEAAKRGWPILMKDKRIRHRQAEIDAVIEHCARCFVIANGELPSVHLLRTRRQDRAASPVIPRAQVVAEADGWSVFVPGLPVAADAATFDEAIVEMRTGELSGGARPVARVTGRCRLVSCTGK
jgi:hypothetical protein